jgi:ferrochelatase
MKGSKPAVLLLNLGSPDSTSVPDVKNYLREFLMDERVLDAPFAIRWFLVNALILPKRPKASAEAYSKVWTDEGSPLIVTSKETQELVQKEVEVPVALAMRYGNPSIPDTIKTLVNQGIDDLFIIPLYPQYAMSSYETVEVRVKECLREMAPHIRTHTLQPFYNDPEYIDALIDSAQPYLENGFDKLLFSFHGIPERHLRQSDPSHAHCLVNSDCCSTCNPAHATCYKHQCMEVVRLFVEKTKLPEDKYAVSFQSRLGREPWLRPYTDLELERLGNEKLGKLLVICPAFVADCLETLEEIAMEGKHTFIEAGGKEFEHIPCLNTNSQWIQFLKNKVNNWLQPI